MGDTGERRGAGFPTGLVAGLFFLVGLIVLLLLLRDEETREVGDPIGQPDITVFEARVEGQLEPVTIRPVSALRVRARNVVWRDAAGRPLLSSPALSFAISLGAAASGDILVHDGVIERLELNLVRTAGGAWNYDRVLEGILAAGGGGAGDEGGGRTSFRLRDIVIQSGAVRVQLPDAVYRAMGLRVALASAELSGPGIPDPIFRIASASALLQLPDTAGGTVDRELALEDARLRIVEGALAFQVDSGRFGSSRFAAAEGVWDPALGGIGVDAALTVTDGRLADLPWLPGEVPEGTSGAFRLRVEPAGAATALTLTDATITAPGSSVRGSLRVVLSPGGIAIREVDARVDPLDLDLIEAFTGPLPYSGDLRGTIQGTGGDIRFDVDASLASTPGGDRFLTRLTGRVAFTDAGLEVRSASASLDQVPLQALQALVPGLPLAGPVTGTVTLAGPPGEAPLQLDIRLEAGGGIITVAGTVDLTAPVPRYDLTGRLMGVELRRVLEPAAPPAQIHAAFALAGTGLEPETAVARLSLNGSFTGWVSEPGDTLAVEASVERGLLHAEQARLELGPVQLAASGDWRFAGGTGGSIRYDLEVASLAPLGPYLPRDPSGQRQFARGRLSAEGILRGTLDAPALIGSIEASEFRFGEWAAEALSGEYDVQLGPGLPRIDARFAGRELRSPGGDFEAASLMVDFDRPDFQVALRADQLEGGIVEIEADGLIDDTGQRQILLRRAEVDLGEQRWRLPSTAEIAWTTGGAVTVEGLRLEQVDGSGLIRADGVVAPWDELDLDLEVRRLPTGEVVALTGSRLNLTGFLSLEGSVRGPAARPTVALEFALEEGSFRDVVVQNVEGRLTYADGTLRLDGSGLLGDSARVQVEGTAPARIALGLPPTFELIEDGPLDVRIFSDDFPLATLDPGLPMVQEIVGRLDADIRLGGTPDQPSLGGRVQVSDGAFTVPLLDRRYEEVGGVAVLEGRVLRVDSLVARSDGFARVTGQMVFDQLTNPSFDLTAELDGFRPQGIEGDDGAAAWGTLLLGGSLETPVLRGDLILDEGHLSLAPIQEGPQFSEAFVGADDPFEPLLGRDMELDEGAPGGGLVVRDLEVTAREDLWFRTEEARAQLSGRLILNKQGPDFSIQGQLQGDQGTFTLRVGPRLTRQFDIMEANIRFFGSPEPNPALDITASRLVRTADGRDVDVRIRVGGTFENPSLTLASAEGAAVPESELFCFVALARPCSELTAFGGGSALSDLVALYGFTDILSEVDLGLDYFQVGMRPGQGLFGGLYLTAGEEFDEPLDDLFLLAEIPIGDVARFWEMAVEWRIDRQWTLELAYEPSSVIRNAATGHALPSDFFESGHQFLLALRRRWTY